MSTDYWRPAPEASGTVPGRRAPGLPAPHMYRIPLALGAHLVLACGAMTACPAAECRRPPARGGFGNGGGVAARSRCTPVGSAKGMSSFGWVSGDAPFRFGKIVKRLVVFLQEVSFPQAVRLSWARTCVYVDHGVGARRQVRRRSSVSQKSSSRRRSSGRRHRVGAGHQRRHRSQVQASGSQVQASGYHTDRPQRDFAPS